MYNEAGLKFKVFIGLGVVLIILLLAGQSFSLLNYELTVSLGLQESVEEVTPVGVAWAKGFALGDTLAYIPLLIVGIIGLLKSKKWGFYAMFASSAISVYWPIVNLSAIYFGRDALALNPDKYVSFSIILPLISVYGLWGMWYLYRHQKQVLNECS